MKKLLFSLLALTMIFSPAALLRTQAAESEAFDFIGMLTAAKTPQSFTGEPVRPGDLNKILQAGLSAPSAMNSQPWHFTVVTSKEVLQGIEKDMAAAMDPMPESSQLGAAPEKKIGLADAPLAIIISQAHNMESDLFDCGIACQSMSVAAQSLGYGTVMLGSPTIALNGEKQAQYKAQLGIPTSMSAVVVLAIGEKDAAIDAVTSASSRYPMQETVNYID